MSYQDALAAGWSLTGARGDIAHSTEAQSDLARLFNSVLGRDPTREDPSRLITIPVERTMVGGRWVFEA